MKESNSLFCLFLFTLLLIPHSFFSQVIENRLRDVPLTVPVFNTAFIKLNRVKAISSSLSTKPDNQSIIDKGLTENFLFDTLGRLMEFNYTRVKDYKEREVMVPAVYSRKGRRIRPASVRYENSYIYDTIFTSYFYNPAGKLIGTRSTDNFYYDTHYYDYDSLGRLVKEVRCKETNTGSGRRDFRLGVQQVLTLETFGYEKLTDKQSQMRHFNDEGRQYKKTIMNYDDKQQLTDRNEEFVVGWTRVRTVYRYDSLGRLASQLYTSNSGGDTKEAMEFGYDEAGNVLSEKKYDNEMLVANTEYLYDPQKKFVTSRIVRFFGACTIGITKYTYSFY